jgi:aryl-alcohol dehydrogenase
MNAQRVCNEGDVPMETEQKATEMKAAVVRNAGDPLVIEDVSLGAPRPTEVLVRIVATGVCHTDIVVRNQQYSASSRR